MTADYRTLRTLPEEDRLRLIRSAHPDRVGGQWPNSVLDSVENHILRMSHGMEVPSPEPFEFAVWFLGVAVAEGGFTPAYSGHWLLRLAALALRFDPPIAGMPPEMSPDGAARRVLALLPISRKRYRQLRGRWEREYPSEEPADGGQQLVQDVGWTVPALAWVRGAVVDPVLRDEVDAWLAVP